MTEVDNGGVNRLGEIGKLVYVCGQVDGLGGVIEFLK